MSRIFLLLVFTFLCKDFIRKHRKLPLTFHKNSVMSHISVYFKTYPNYVSVSLVVLYQDQFNLLIFITDFFFFLRAILGPLALIMSRLTFIIFNSGLN